MGTEAFAPAKINLSLHVTGQRADGYHLLDSLVVFANVGDRLWFEPGSEMSLEVCGPFSNGVPADARNLVWKAAELAGWCGHIRLEKNLPNGAGIGGGSADAAALLRHFLGDKAQDVVGLEKVLSLGADVPVCVSAVPQRMSGIGEVLSRCWPIPELNIVLINPGISVPTPSVFSALQDRNNAPMDALHLSTSLEEFIDWLAYQRNDLEPIAVNLFPEIATALDALEGAIFSRMSGSGATCFGIYSNAKLARDAAHKIREQYPDWWVQRACTIGAKSD